MKISSNPEQSTVKLNSNSIQAKEFVQPKKLENKSSQQDKTSNIIENSENIKLKPEKLQELVKAANEVMEAMDKKLEFSIHEGTHRTIVKIIDRAEDKVIREIPSEKMLDLVAKMWEVVGLFVDERA